MSSPSTLVSACHNRGRKLQLNQRAPAPASRDSLLAGLFAQLSFQCPRLFALAQVSQLCHGWMDGWMY